MSNKTIKNLTTSTAIALASIGAPAFAQEATAPAKPVESNTATTAVAKPQVKPLEKSAVDAPATVKPALDAQKAVVKDADAKVATAEANVKAKETAQASAEKEVANATQAVKDAEATASQATPEKVAQVKDAQVKNVEAQTANQKATETVNDQIKAETKALSAEQAKVATANAKVAETAKDVKTAEQAVANAQAAIDGSGLASAQKDLTQAQADVKTTTKSVEDAKTAKANADKSDASRAEAIKSAEIDVNTKNDAVKLSKEKLATATEHASNVASKLETAKAELKTAEDKLAAANVHVSKDVIKIGNPTTSLARLSEEERKSLGTSLTEVTFKDAWYLWKYKGHGIPGIANPENQLFSKLLHATAVDMISNSIIKIDQNDKNRPIDINNLTDAQLIEVSEFYAKLITQLNHNFGYNASKKAYISKEILNHAKSLAKKYEERALDPNVAGHIPGNLENLTPIGTHDEYKTMYDLKYATMRAFKLSSFEDEPSKWGHLINNLSNHADSSIAVTVANINGKYWMITLFGGNDETPFTKETDTASLEKAVATAQSNVDQATTASENAKNALTKASTDYASALSLKTDAEKVLADAMAKPLQAQVAENNLRLAEIALDNAKKRETKATEAIANFTASLSERKLALAKAQDALKEAKAVQTTASQSLADAQAELQAQEAKVDALNKQSAKLLEEKDALVKDAKKLAEQLQAYLDAPAKLATTKEAKATVEAKLETAKAELKTAQTALETVQAEQKAETAKLTEIEAKYAKLVDLAEKAQENVVAKLPDGTVIAVPKVAPTAENLPELNLAEVAKEDAKDSVIKTLPNGTIVAVPNVAPTAEALPEANVEELKKEVDKEKVAIQNNKPVTVAEKFTTDKPKSTNKKELPKTGENSSIILMLLGAILGVFGLVTVRRKN